ncbi:MAG: bifunctional (p)ppGpp synthetase/guanosine-3',5'-bis(diphosphate) 3'-pyrophosphohydrolase [Acidobacteria bacterium]|nr:bifunctional (p)ppGpp synthetase/guanosine-3',5'-bis(diphosphate) 3'-pyrophosphohydrolase [Acidobacteriota bacterium]
MESLAQIEETVARNRPGEDLGLLRKAYNFSVAKHAEQRRLSGEPFVAHPLAVARILADMRLDAACIAAGILHDVVEDTATTSERIAKEFGPQVARIVEGVTKISRIQFHSPEEQQAENYRKIVLAMVDDVRVILVKLAYRLHNMRTLEYLPPDKRERMARETMEIYAPIAHRLGIGKFRGELEDLAFRYLEPETFEQLRAEVESRRKVGEKFLSEVRAAVEKKMKEHEIPGRVEGRTKRLYSLQMKLKRQRIPLEQVYDLMAVRLITDSVRNCYAALGVVHSTWPPVPGRIKDFIAIPRPNLYQSIHTSVIGPHGQPFEVQIRTEEMHRVAEEGIAAHWRYKDGKIVAEHETERFAWLRQIVEWQREVRDSGEFLSTFKIDLYPEEVYTFTPKGKVMVMPRDATVIDFAYAIHTQVGQTCSGAKVNGRLVPLRTKLRNGDIVEIITQADHTPSRDWLTLVKTSRARNKIKHWINIAEREQAVEIGKKLLDREARKYGLSLKKIKEDDYLKEAKVHGYTSVEDLYAAMGYGKLGARQVLGKLFPEDQWGAETARPARSKRAGEKPGAGLPIEVHGVDDLLVYRAKCCSPIRGDEIVGYITRGKGISVHAKDCPNVQSLIYDSARRIEVEWVGTMKELYPVKLTLYTEDRQGLLAEVTSVISETQSNIQNIEARTANQRAVIDVTLDVADRAQLENAIALLRRVNGVFDVERVMRA